MAERQYKKNMVADVEAENHGLTLRQGNTTFFIDLHFNENSKETLEEKVKKLIRQDVENGIF